MIILKFHKFQFSNYSNSPGLAKVSSLMSDPLSFLSEDPFHASCQQLVRDLSTAYVTRHGSKASAGSLSLNRPNQVLFVLVLFSLDFVFCDCEICYDVKIVLW